MRSRVALYGQAGAGMHHRRAPGVAGGDDLLCGDALQVGRQRAHGEAGGARSADGRPPQPLSGVAAEGDDCGVAIISMELPRLRFSRPQACPSPTAR